MIEPGVVLAGKLQVERVLGKGGMGVVLAARHLGLDQRVAVKVLHPAIAQDPTIMERFLREARSAARLRSEHVCRVSDVGRLDDGAPYIVMELLEGSDLATVVERAPLAVATAVDHVLQACIAIAEAHALGIVHRDLKPANLFLTRSVGGAPLVKVLDFGIAKVVTADELALTRTDTIMGSPGYMAPEQLRSARDVDARTDLWAIGVILYQLVSRRLPFAATSITELSVKIAMDPPEPLEVDPAFRAVVFRCLEKDPAGRYADVGKLATALVPFGGPTAAAHVATIVQLVRTPLAFDATAVPVSGGETIATLPPGTPPPTTTLQGAAAVSSPAAPRRARVLGTAAAAGVVTIGAVATILALRSSPPQQPPPATTAPTTTAPTTTAPTTTAPATNAPTTPTAMTPTTTTPTATTPASTVPRSSSTPTTAAPAPTSSIPPPRATSTPPKRPPAPLDKPAALAALDSDGTVAMFEGRWDRAIEISKKILALDPDNSRARYWLVSAACAHGEAALAQQHAKRLTDDARAKLQRYVCDREGIQLTPP